MKRKDVFSKLVKGQIGLQLMATILFVLSINAQAQTNEPSNHPDAGCGRFGSTRDVVDCAMQNHPDIKRARAALRQGDELESEASQIPNPEFDSKVTVGKQLGDNVRNTEIALAPVIELGGKRGARIDKARAEREVIASDLLKTKEEVFIGTLLSLYRLRQVESESNIVEEALNTFGKIQRLFSSRLNLSPEQRVSLGVFQLAEGDYKLRKATLSTETNAVLKNLGLAVGGIFEPTSQILPARKTSWPELSDSLLATPFLGSRIKNAQAELKTAQAELELARSASWPDLKIGPAFENQVQGPFSFQAYGGVLSFPLPLFNQNGGGRAVANRGLDKAETELHATTLQLNSERAILLQRYQIAIKVLKDSASISEVEKKHQSMEALFQRGLIPSSLVIEAHRQIFDFTKSQNELELSAIEALLRLYAFEGRLFEEKL